MYNKMFVNIYLVTSLIKLVYILLQSVVDNFYYIKLNVLSICFMFVPKFGILNVQQK